MMKTPSTLPAPEGENPVLSDEEIKALRRRKEPSLALPAGSKVGDIGALTKKLMEESLQGAVEINDTNGENPTEQEPAPEEKISVPPRSSMTPERLATTNIPPSQGIFEEAARSLFKTGTDEVTETVSAAAKNPDKD